MDEHYNSCLGAGDLSENGESRVPDPGGSTQHPGQETDSPVIPPRSSPNATYTNVVSDDIEVADSSAAADNNSVSVRSNRVLALLLLTLVYILNS